MIDYKAHSEKVELCIAKIHKEWKPLFVNMTPNSKKGKQRIRGRQIAIIENCANEYNLNMRNLIKIIGLN